jgi:hypothetical protein
MTTQPDGRTARQIKHAPPGAFFVWSRSHVSYALSLAKIPPPLISDDYWREVKLCSKKR